MSRAPKVWEIDSEHEVLDAITLLLERKEHRRGLTLEAMAEGTGYAVGRVREVCLKSECVLKRRSHNRKLWWNDWRDVEDVTAYGCHKPVRKMGRPRKKAA